mmetsp:Transcript_21964/g.16311  ORF Transcript_21964/g.16311 Transcript_21964/m.16311 type:complete len:121 (-) Transcript_21964:1438-1800(-)
MVVSLCAMTIVVTCPSFSLISSMAFCTSFSFLVSSAEVASSKISTLGFLINALAMAILCFYPPESCPPDCPTCKSSQFSLSSKKLRALAFCRASLISSSVASGFPNMMFLRREVLNKIGS